MLSMRDLYLVNIWGIYGKNKVRYTIEGSKSDRNGKYNSRSGKHTGASDILQFYSSRLRSPKPIWALTEIAQSSPVMRDCGSSNALNG